ncbi:MAG: 50S ribosomal protein L5, partial [Beijerinckiaceae bacterium]
MAKAPEKNAKAAPAKSDAAADSKKVKASKSEVAGGVAGKAAANVAGYTARMRKHYDEVVRPEMIKQFGYKNAMQVPTVEKIVLNMGV